jgi:uncharacterized repeat protein (TIGR01451 family)/uncharacterized delta-60 repeat protein
MQRLRISVCLPVRLGWVALGAAAWVGLAAPAFGAAPPNDNFANAIAIPVGFNDWGTITGTNATATAEPGEPAHAGTAAANSVWYSWTAPKDGIVYLDAFNSSFTARLAVYTGTVLSNLSVVAASDFNATSAHVPGGYPSDPAPNYGTGNLGGLRFRASAGTTYYIAADTETGGTGAFTLTWAYHSSGIFRFTSTAYTCSEEESQVPAGQNIGHTVQGVVITVTRMFGCDGQVMLGYMTTTNVAVRGTGTNAVPDTDFRTTSGTLVFQNGEMSRSFVVPIVNNNAPQDNRYFGIILTNIVLGTNEFSTLIDPPRLDTRPAYTNTTVTIYDVNVDRLEGFQTATNPLVNIEKSTFRVAPGDTSANTLQISFYVNRYDISSSGCRIAWVVDDVYINNSVQNGETDFYDDRYWPLSLSAGSDYAIPPTYPVPPYTTPVEPPDFWPSYYNYTPSPESVYYGTLTWGQNDLSSKEIIITITNDARVKFNRDFHVVLKYVPQATDNANIGYVGAATVTILYNHYPAGALDPSFNPDYTTATDPPNNPYPGANGTVFGLAMQANDQPVVVGNFTAYNTTPRNRIARLNVNGALDPTFDPGAGADNFINAVAVTPAGQIVVGGGFTSFNGYSRRGVARLNFDGSVDGNFNPGLGADGTVWALDLQLPNGQVVIGGDFGTVNGEVRKYIARLMPNGSVDETFNPAVPDGILYAVAVDSTGKVIIGGAFSSINGIRRRCIARLNLDGSLDNTFNPGTGVDGPVYAIKIQIDNKILIGGAFTQTDLRQRNSIARLNPDGSLDTTFDPGNGFDGPVYCIGSELSNGTNAYIYAGGLFTSYNDTHRLALARLFMTGELDTGFMDTGYNQFAGFPTGQFTPEVEARSFIFGIGMQTGTNVIVGGGFSRVGGGRNTGNIRPDLTSAESDGYTRKTWRHRNNVARLLGGSTTGPGSIGFIHSTYTVDQNYGAFPVTLVRANGTLGQMGANFSLPYSQAGPGTAVPAQDYTPNVIRPLYQWSWPSMFPNSFGWMKGQGSSGSYYQVQLAVTPSTLVQGNRSIGMELALPSGADVFWLGGENIPLGSALAPARESTFTIVDNNRPAGGLTFTSSSYSVNEGSGPAVITVTRTNGSAGQVTVQFQTTTVTNGFPFSLYPATPGVDYNPTNGFLTFGDGVTNASFAVSIIDNSLVQPDRTVNLQIFSPGGGASLGLTNAVLTIIDNDYLSGHLNFSAPSYSTNKHAGAATITVTRTGGSLNTISVQAITAALSAIPGYDYIPVTNTLTWNSGDSLPKTFTVPLLANGVPEISPTIVLQLVNYSDHRSIGTQNTNAVLTIVNDDFYGDLSFNVTNYTVMENGGYATVTVIRRNGSAQGVTVNYATADGTALAGRDYLATSGVLSFAANEVAKSFTVPILDSAATQWPYPNGQLSFVVNLSNVQPPGPPPATISTPQATVAIIDDEQYYNVPAGSVDTAFVPAGGLDGDVHALALQADGKMVVGGDFAFAGDYSRNGLARFKPDATLDLTFLHDGGGANDSVRTLMVQSDQRTVIGGWFTSVGGYNLKYLARLNFDGTVDSGFTPGAGADNPVYAVAESFVGGARKLLVGGAFASFNQLPFNHIVRLNDDGSVDAGFQPTSGASDTVYAIAVYPTNTLNGGKILIGGAFTNYNGVARNCLARLNPDGSLDSTFNPGAGADGAVYSIAIQLDGRVLIGGAFTHLNGTLSSGVARLNSDGSLDSPFSANLGLHTNGTVYAIALQQDTRILLGGAFSSFSGVTRSNITRLNFDGTVDTSINFGGGADNYVGALAVQTDNNLVLGGGFTNVDGQPRSRLARIYGGSLGAVNPSGSFEFELPVYSYNKSDTNTFVSVRREGGTAGTNVTVVFETADGSAVAGVNYVGVTNTLSFPPGETFANILVPFIPDTQITPDRTVNLILTNAQPADAAQLGLQPQATLVIVNDNCALHFSDVAYSRNENAPDGRATISLVRDGSLLNPVTVSFSTATNGTARPGIDFTMVNQTVTFLVGQSNQNVFVPIFDSQVVSSNKTVLMQLANAGGPGATVGVPAQATLTIINDVRIPQPTNNAFLNARGISGANGTTTVNTVGATAEPGEPAHAGYPATNSVWFAWVAPLGGPVSFDTYGSDFDTVLAAYSGSSLQTLNTVAANDYIYNDVPPWTVNVPSFVPYSNPSKITFNAQAGTTYYLAIDGVNGASGNASLSWSYHPAGLFRFSADFYRCGEEDTMWTGGDGSTGWSVQGARVTVTRVAGATGRALVDLITSDGSAVALTDYQTVLATLVFDDWEMSKSVIIPIIDNPFCGTNRYFNVSLINPRLAAGESTAVLPPRLDTDHSACKVLIEEHDGTPAGNNGLCLVEPYGLVNFQRATYRTTRNLLPIRSDNSVLVYVDRMWHGGTPIPGATIAWVVDSTRGPDTGPGGDTDFLDNGQYAIPGAYMTNVYEFDLSASSDYAKPDPASDIGLGSIWPSADPPDFLPQYQTGPSGLGRGWGQLTWGQNDLNSKPIRITIYNNTNNIVPNFNRDFVIRLFSVPNVNDNATIGSIGETVVTILNNDDTRRVDLGYNTNIVFYEPAGANDHFFNPDNELYSQPAMNTAPGANALVYAMALWNDQAVIGGNFTTYNNTNRNHVARLNTDGTLDTSFDPQGGVTYSINQRLASVTSLALDSSGRVVIGGLMTTYNGVQRNGLARLNANGTLDTAFNPGLGTTNTVWSVLLQPDGKVLAGGEFASFDTQPRRHIARLNADGTLDSTFDPGPNGPDNHIYTMALAPNGTTNIPIVIGGAFTSIGGQLRGGIARLNADGTLDQTFAPLLGANGIVRAVAVQPDGKVLIAGEFTRVDNLPFNRLARLNPDGRVDTTFQPGSGADDTIFNLTLQTDGTIYIGGLFTSFNGTHRLGFARLLANGLVDTSFLDTAYNQFAGLPKPYFNPDVNPKNFVLTSQVESDGKVLIAGSFAAVGGDWLAFNQYGSPAVQTNLAASWMEKEEITRTAIRARANVARLLNNPTPGPGNLGFVQSAYNVNENGGYRFVQMTRDNGTLARMGANFSLPGRTTGEGKAQAGVDYTFSNVGPIYETTHGDGYGMGVGLALGNGFGGRRPNYTRCYSDAFSGTNNADFDVVGRQLFPVTSDDVIVTIVPNPANRNNLVAPLALDTPSQMDGVWLGGENVAVGGALGQPAATLTILSDYTRPGVVGFDTPEYYVNAADGTATITLSRTNGTDGLVSVQYATTNEFLPPPTAVAGVDYTTSTGTLTFGDGQPTASFTIPIINSSKAGPDLVINLKLFAPAGGVALGATNAICYIINNNFSPGHVNFSSGSYVTNNDTSAALITVNRTGGNAGAVSVDVAATDGTNALSGRDYLAFTNTLAWNDGDTASKTVLVPILGSTTVQPDKQVLLRLFNPSTNGLVGNIHSNAVLTILNNHFYGQVQFLMPAFSVKENGSAATITVVRVGGSSDQIAVNYATSDGTAGSSDYLPTSGTLVFTNGEVSKTFTVQINDNTIQDGNRFFRLSLSSPSPASALGTPASATVTIIDDETYNEPAGSLDTAFNTTVGADGNVLALGVQSDNRIVIAGDFSMVDQVSHIRIARINPYDASLDNDFWATVDATIRAMVSQTDDRVLIGGDFTNVNGVVYNKVARLSYDGTLDTSFQPGAGADNPVYALAETFINGQRKLMIGGNFTVFNSVGRNRIVRLNDDGSVDTSFDPGQGADGPVYAVAVYPTNTLNGGKILIGGSFANVRGVGRPGIARLNADGTLDATFDPGTGANDVVRAVAIQTDGRVLLGGSFTSVRSVVRNRIARLNADGSMDSTFDPGLGANDSVYTIALQQDQRIVLGGEFTACSGVTRGRITRLMPDGSVDPMINFGAGANGFVAAVAIQQEPFIDNPQQQREKIVIGGGFNQFNGLACQHFGRLYGGSLGGMGSFEFVSPSFTAVENGTNTLITVRRTGGTSGPQPDGSTTVAFMTSDGMAVSGVNYVGVTNTLTFPLGETVANVLVTIIDDLQINPDRTVNLALTNPQPVITGGPQLGRQPIATLTILNDDAGVSFSSPTYSRDENASDGAATIDIYRFGNTNSTVTVDFATTTNGTAVIGTNYFPVTNTIVFLPGDTNRSIKVPIVNNNLIEGNKTVVMLLSNATGALLLEPSQAVLTIIDDNRAPGQFLFATNANFVSQGAGNAVITVLRTNGSSGVVTVDYSTVSGSAIAGVDFIFTSNTLAFAEGETSKQIVIPIIQHALAGLDKSLTIVLTNTTGGAAILGSSSASLTILDNHEAFSFTLPSYSANETDGSVPLTVFRQNGSNHLTTVHYATTNITAQAGTNYVAITDGFLTFNPGETIKSFSVPLLHDPRVTGNLFFGVNLFNPTPPAQVFNYSSAVVAIVDVDPGFTFATTNLVVVTNADLTTVTNAGYGVIKSTSTNILISVLRSNANTGTVSVRYATVSNATDNAQSPLDYTTTSGLLTFSNNIALQSFTVPINPNQQVRGDRTFSIVLSNPSPGAQLIPPSTATVTITDDITGLSFSSPTYSKAETGGSATIAVLRSNYTNSIVSVPFYTTDGTATNGMNYFATNGILVFTNGETVKTFDVQLKDDGHVTGDKTVLLSLGTPVGNAQRVDPQSSTLTVTEADGSLIVESGMALTWESGPVNGVIDPGETVKLLVALRDSVGTNTANLVATLLATNGVVTNSPQVQSYGALVVHGPSVSREFTFKANGSDGQTITATFQLRDGSKDLGQVAISFTLGKSSLTVMNSSGIKINDAVSATPYPSVINVSGLAGQVVKVTTTLTNFNHSWPNDVDVLLVSPPTPDSATGRKSYLMTKCGSSYIVTNLTLTFDDAAATSLPHFAPLVSGTNQPTSYALATPPFPAASTPPPPYNTNLSVFNGINPNGAWSLYVLDDTLGNDGAISNGWVLNLTTAGNVSPAADVGLAMTGPSGTVTTTSNVTFTLTVTNYGPAGATNIVVSNTLPAGTLYVSATPSQGTVVTNGANLVTWTIDSMAKDASASLSLVLQANVVGQIVNSATVATTTTDKNPDDNTASAAVNVAAPSADLSLSLIGGPNPVLVGNYLTYTLTIRNAGSATATHVTASDTLPASVAFVSASPAGYTLAGQVVTFTDLGNLGSNSQISASITVQALGADTITDSARCSSAVIDPLKANNTASVKTIVQLPTLAITHAGKNLVISWPASLWTFGLYSTTNLHPPVVWTRIDVPGQSLVGGANWVAVPIDSVQKYFRLSIVSTSLLQVNRSGAGFILSWPTNATGYALQSATNLHPPVVWTPMSGVSPGVVGDQYALPISKDSGSKFFRLHPTP